MFARINEQNKNFGWLVNLKPFREKSLSGFPLYKVFTTRFFVNKKRANK